MTTTREILIKARALIAEPHAWTQGANAVTAQGIITFPQALDAVKFCSMGAVARAGMEPDKFEACLHLLAKAIPPTFRGGVIKFNDDPQRTHAEILTWFDRAISDV